MAHKPHFLVTAGNTREKIDAVRDWGNIFTGKTGLDIALALLDLGDVTLVTSNQAHAREHDGFSGKAGMLGVETFSTHAELRDLLQERLTGKDAVPTDAICMTAAVSDYRPAGAYRVLSRAEGEPGQETWVVENVQAAKVKSTHAAIAILGEPTEKIIDLFRTHWGYNGMLIKFKLEAGISEKALVRVAQESRVASGADYIVANTLEMLRPEQGEAAAYVLGPKLRERISRAELAGRLRDLIRSKIKS